MVGGAVEGRRAYPRRGACPGGQNAAVDDPDAPAPPEVDDRVVERLAELGIDREQALEAVAQRRVVLTVVEHELDGGRRSSAAEVQERTGLDAATLQRLDRAVGIRPDRGYSAVDVEHLEVLAKLSVLLPLDALIDAVQANTAPMTAIALRSMETFTAGLLRPLQATEPDEVAVGRTLAAAARPLLELSGKGIDVGFRRVVQHLLTSELLAAATRDEEEVRLAIGFADVVGYTSLTARVDPTGLADVLDAFEQRCYSIAADVPDVRLVKFMGDAVMAVSVDPVPLAEVLLRVVHEQPGSSASASGSALSEEEAVAQDPLADVPRRAGMAAGHVLLRSGDYYGTPVNLAARLTDRARPGTLLAAEDLKVALGDYDLRRLRSLHLHGIGRHRPLAVRPAVAEAPPT